MLLVCKGKLQYTLFIKVVGGKEFYRKKKQMLKLKCIRQVLWSHVTKRFLVLLKQPGKIILSAVRGSLIFVPVLFTWWNKTDAGKLMTLSVRATEDMLGLGTSVLYTNLLLDPGASRRALSVLGTVTWGHFKGTHEFAWSFRCDMAQWNMTFSAKESTRLRQKQVLLRWPHC